MKTIFEKQPSIPTGSELRILLNSGHISVGEIQSVLKEKGVFVGSSEKSVTVPILAATLLKPSEFNGLVDASVNRESKPKVKVSSLDLSSPDIDWISPLKTSLFASEFKAGAKDSVKFEKSPNLIVDSQEKVTIPYVISRHDISQDYIERELTFPGSVTIEKQGNKLKLEFSSVHSSKETEDINRRILLQVSKILNDQGVVKTEKPITITFNSFSNVERVRFFKRLTAGNSPTLDKGNVIDMDVNRDPDGPALPNNPEVSWLNQTVSRVRIDGKKLNDIFLISDEKYYPYYHIQRMNVTFPFKVGTNSGHCQVAFFFSGPARGGGRDEDELVHSTSGPTFDERANADAQKIVKEKVERAIRELIDREYSKIVSDRPVSGTS